ncbi:hypothetical protein [Pedobacter faecalis]|uniref:hypothetical protein n=1 Tax=Pedobacter faecalis TaxID=3041495 RepID=UPI00254B9ECF|nr:hypothetical protein [Pedobacter sp. ELA7]
MLKVKDKSISSVFINLGQNADAMELLFFFDLEDLSQTQYIAKNILKEWAHDFKDRYGFNHFICREELAGDIT